MNKKTIIIILIIAAAVVGLVAWSYGNTPTPTNAQLAGTQPNGAQPNEPQSSGSNSLAASETFYDFGTISMANGKVDHLFHVTNSGDEDIRVNSISTSCMCTTAYFVNGNSKDGPFGMPGMGYISAADEVIPAHAARDIDVIFDPAAHGPSGVGNIDRFAYVGVVNGGTLQFEVKAVVTP